MDSTREILRLDHVSKSFVGVKAMQDVSFDLRAGEVHCLCGENGAGKSTLIKVLSGAHQPDAGAIYFEGRKVALTPHLALALGIQTIYQEHIVFDSLSVMENIFMGLEVARRGLLDRREMRRRTVEVLEVLKADLRPEAIMGRLSSGQQKTVEIAKGLVFKRKVIILDEPTASFSAGEIDNLLDIIRTVRASGIGII
jgi:ABC-type sugar transport system ATPase subunit